jgi:hypothetical protein
MGRKSGAKCERGSCDRQVAAALETEGQVILDPGDDDKDPWAPGAGAPDHEEEGLQ